MTTTTRRDFLKLATVAAIAPAFSGSPSKAAAGRPPNVVFILADDLGYGDVGCYGATKVKTPNIDRLAREGLRFTDAHSPSSVCTPSRYNLLTGRYCWRTWAGTSCVWSTDPLLIDTDRLTLPKLFNRNGYTTACVGKWHLGFGKPGQEGWDGVYGPDYNQPLKPGPLELGFDHFFGIPHVGQLPHVYNYRLPVAVSVPSALANVSNLHTPHSLGIRRISDGMSLVI